MTKAEFEKIVHYLRQPSLAKQGEREIFAYRINNSILLTWHKFNTGISLYIYEQYEETSKYFITILNFKSYNDFITQLKQWDTNGKVLKYLRSVGFSKFKRSRLQKTAGTIEYEKISYIA